MGGLYQITQGTQIGFYNKRWNATINAGVDMSMVPNNPQYKRYVENLIELVNEGRVEL